MTSIFQCAFGPKCTKRDSTCRNLHLDVCGYYLTNSCRNMDDCRNGEHPVKLDDDSYQMSSGEKFRYKPFEKKSSDEKPTKYSDKFKKSNKLDKYAKKSDKYDKQERPEKKIEDICGLDPVKFDAAIVAAVKGDYKDLAFQQKLAERTIVVLQEQLALIRRTTAALKDYGKALEDTEQ